MRKLSTGFGVLGHTSFLALAGVSLALILLSLSFAISGGLPTSNILWLLIAFFAGGAIGIMLRK